MAVSFRLLRGVCVRYPQAAALAMMAAAVLALHVAGWGLLLSQHASTQATLGVGLGVTAYALGLRHAFDADHIAAVDNTTRKLVDDGRKPVSVGFWFALGHSTVVLGLTVLLASGAHALSGPLADDDSVLHRVTGIIGASVSGLFLYLIAAVNIHMLVGTWRLYRKVRAEGDFQTRHMEIAPAVRGPLSLILARITKAIRAPWQMYPLGVLFGIGFDTATEIGLLVLATGGAVAGVPWYSLLSLPLIFAAGMTLLDTADGVLMRFAYGWAYADPARKLRYNLSITALSVLVAVGVGTAELVHMAATQLGLNSTGWGRLSDVDLTAVGPATVVLLTILWLGVVVLRRKPRSPTSASTPVLLEPGWRRGRVSWFNDAKGFGFLIPDDGGPAVLVDCTAIVVHGFRTLEAGEQVVFTARPTDRGPEAALVRPDRHQPARAVSSRPCMKHMGWPHPCANTALYTTTTSVSSSACTGCSKT
ncbi:HoxN/HupN/NixA family nickel/cobalt transporter [Nocardia pneumoniae]|uniref:HoxN/HupN/NixA family nickel/cobalt transporter n=1 Tax=Nocardia pneumoniae TaxID=228601 RepID=UPI0002DC0216|nr:cold shock domain-containing protein [Nocardia pneumoniae]